jgi:hypothetical protein
MLLIALAECHGSIIHCMNIPIEAIGMSGTERTKYILSLLTFEEVAAEKMWAIRFALAQVTYSPTVFLTSLRPCTRIRINTLHPNYEQQKRDHPAHLARSTPRAMSSLFVAN